jgi:hypothetical protein
MYGLPGAARPKATNFINPRLTLVALESNIAHGSCACLQITSSKSKYCQARSLLSVITTPRCIGAALAFIDTLHLACVNKQLRYHLSFRTRVGPDNYQQPLQVISVAPFIIGSVAAFPEHRNVVRTILVEAELLSTRTIPV